MLDFRHYHDSHFTNPRCGLCYRVMADVGTFTTAMYRCPRCENQDAIAIEPYDRRKTLVSPDGNIWYSYRSHGVWIGIDQDAREFEINELDLPGNLIPLDEWRAQQRAADRIILLYSAVSQLTLLEAAL